MGSNRGAEGASIDPVDSVSVSQATWDIHQSVLALFFWISHQVVGDFTERGWTFRGLSAKYERGTVLLVVKGSVDGRRVVAFFTGVGLRETIEFFYAKFQADTVRWILDKY
jgi:hypothetical protein